MTSDPTPPPSSGLGRTAIRGAGQTTVGQLLRMILQILGVVVLARLLGPNDYGLMALGLAVVGFGEIFRDAGLSTAAIRSPNLSRDQRSNLFWLNSAFGLAMWLLSWALAPVIAAVFGQPRLIELLGWLTAVFLINGVTAQYRADLTRRMRFLPLAVIDVAAQAGGIVLAVGLALAGAGVMALVAQVLGGAAITLIMAVAIQRWLPGRPRRGTGIRPMLRFGVGMLGSQFVGFVSSNVDTIVLGLRFDVASVGLYNRGFQLLMRPLGQLRGPSTSVAVPVLSKLDGTDPQAARFISRGQLALGYTLVPVMAVAAGAASPIIDVALGPAWSAAVPVFALLAVAGALQTLSYVGYWVYVSRGLSAALFRYSLISLSIKVLAVLVGSVWGVAGVAGGIAVASAVAWPVSLAWLNRLTTIPVRTLYAGAGRIVLCAVGGGFGALSAVSLASAWPSIIQIVLAVVAAAVAYGVLALVVRPVRGDFIVLMTSIRAALRRRGR